MVRILSNKESTLRNPLVVQDTFKPAYLCGATGLRKMSRATTATPHHRASRTLISHKMRSPHPESTEMSCVWEREDLKRCSQFHDTDSSERNGDTTNLTNTTYEYHESLDTRGSMVFLNPITLT